MSTDPLLQRLSPCIGDAHQTQRTALDPVSSVLIRRWQEAFGDNNPDYLHQGTVPPAMLAAFTGRSLAESRQALLGQTALANTLEELGFITPGTAISQSYQRDIQVGDIISEVHWPESISERKQTRIGTGYFITYRTDFSNQHDEPVGTQRLTTFAFQPDNQPEAVAAAQKSGSSDKTSSTRAAAASETLPEHSISLDRAGVIACCSAMGDFNPTHYDPALAEKVGFSDIFTDIFAGIGFTQAYVGNRIGPGARFTSIDVKLGVPLYPGDTLILNGSVIKRDSQSLSVSVIGLCSLGMQLAATAKLELLN